MSFFDKLRRTRNAQKELPQKPGLIGLDIGDHDIHLCQLKPESNNRYSIVAKSSLGFEESRKELLASPKQFKKLLARAVNGKSFKGRKVTAILPSDDVKIMLLTYKSSTQDVDAEVVRMLSQRIEGNIDDYVIDYLPVRNNASDEEHVIMASVARRNVVNQFLDTLSSAGLQVQSLDIGPSTLRRLISVLYSENKTSNVLLINTGLNNSYLTIVSGRRLLLDQPVNFGCHQLLEEISKALDLPLQQARELIYRHGFSASNKSDKSVGLVSDSDVSQTLLEIVKPAFINLVEEINRVLIYTASETHGIPLSRVYILGCMARLPGAHDLMMSLLDIPVPEFPTEFFDIFIDQDEITEPWSSQLPELAIATGLALRGLQPDE